MRQESRLWRNWAGNVVFQPERYVLPRSLSELQEAVSQAKQVRVVARGHSQNEGVVSEETAVDLRHLDRVLSLDTQTCQIRVEAGMRLHQLNAHLEKNGLCIENPGNVDFQSLAGLLATASHGSSPHRGTLCENVVALDLILADGSLRSLSSQDGSLFQAALCSMGLLGVVYAVTLQASPVVGFYKRQELITAQQMKEELTLWSQRGADALSALHQVEYWLIPYTGRAIRMTMGKVPLPRATPRWLRFLKEWHELLFQNGIFWCFLQGVRLRQGGGREGVEKWQRFWVPFYMKLLCWGFSPTHRRDQARYVFRSPRLFRAVDCEYAFSKKAVLEVLNTLESKFGLFTEPKGKWVFSMPLHLRILGEEGIGGAKSESLLSPNRGRSSFYVDVAWYNHLEEAGEALQDVAGVLSEVAEGDGRPHWGKVLKPLPRLQVDESRRLELDTFFAWRESLDPQEKFLSAFWRRTFAEFLNPALNKRELEIPDTLEKGGENVGGVVH